MLRENRLVFSPRAAFEGGRCDAEQLAVRTGDGDATRFGPALKLAEAAIDLNAGAVRTRETRLRILVRLGKWDKALADVEACESLLRGRADFHRLAALVYRNLKLTTPAEEHERRAKELMADD